MTRVFLIFSLMPLIAHAVPFFRGPNSSFSSGEETQQKLELTKTQSLTGKWAIVQSHARSHTFRILRQHLATIADVRTENKDYIFTRDFIELTHITNSDLTTIVPPSSRLELLKIEAARIRVRYLDQEYFAPISNYLNALHFCHSIKTSQGVQKVASVRGFELITDKKQTLSFEQAKNCTTVFALGYNLETLFLQSARGSFNLKNYQPLKIISEQSQIWNKSYVRGHGEVWWREGSQEKREKLISSKQLFQRKIFDIARADHIFIASAEGIYRSFDGENWQKISQFQNENHPVAIARDGTIFVGSFVSRDNANHFENFVHFDHMIRTITTQSKRAVGSLQIQKITPVGGDSEVIQLQLNSGEQKKIEVKTLNQGRTWKLISTI